MDETKIPSIYASREDPKSESRISRDSILLFFLSEPLAVIAAADDPVTCAVYAKDNDLLELDAYKRFKPIAKRQQKLLRMLVNQAKLRSNRTAPKYQYGFEISIRLPACGTSR
jgi:hypothetical protein